MIRLHLQLHKKKYYWSFGIIVALIIIAYIYLRISAMLHFNLQTELLTTHTPAQFGISTTNNATVSVTIDTKVDTFHACDSICDYSVDGVYSLQNQTQTQITHTLSISTPTRGFGEELFYFKSSCKTIPSTFCPSSQTRINQTSLIRIDYKLQQDEQKVVDSISQINDTLALATQQVADLRYTKQLYDLWPQQNIQIVDDKELASQITYLTRLWKDQDYIHANEVLQIINQSLTNYTPNASLNALLQNIADYNQLQTDIAKFLSNKTIQEYISYAQTRDSAVGTVKQAVTRLTTILSSTYIEDLVRAHVIASGAMQYLQNKTDSYLSDKEQTEQIVSFARTLLPLINTPLTTLPLDTCDAVLELINHNSWAINANETLLNESTARTLIQPINATYVFPITTNYCNENSFPMNITLDVERITTPNQIIIPASPNLSIARVIAPTDICSINSIAIDCTKKKSPILFIHGHAFDESNSPQISMFAFSELQEKLESDGYINAGELSSGMQEEILAPFTMRASYYYIQQYGLGSFSFAVQKSERIENYAIRLKELIDDMKRISGSPNVTIVAHSMGGLVVREYANLFGMDSIDRVITVNTPHLGISGRVVSICSVLGAAKECEDMTENSTFLARLPPITGRWDVIASTGCTMSDGVGDGVVLAQNSVLPGATYYLLNGTCTDALDSNLHTQILTDNRLYSLITTLLENKITNNTENKDSLTN